MTEEQFNKLDTNHDGKVTKEEIDDAMKKMREMMGARPKEGSDAAPKSSGEGGFRKRPEGSSEKPKRPEGE